MTIKPKYQYSTNGSTVQCVAGTALTDLCSHSYAELCEVLVHASFQVDGDENHGRPNTIVGHPAAH